ncbi:aspartyl/asparaginyl beta-hydroxylase domain-containing protein [Niabella pedocola]|uniref:Aspartyl/asparaginyl beta-hydroxylase domain-containing protein n=1 Tax=Niabella pedocola TaxID=1752077 RepID=A0ABS8PL16_9BACT|nr:aspartyl/asparaginyl beta-hydroxylase domain-containing protein [Niabella pedocola]MCD2421799.1 aspartyl/asparaginyl beta-hydroxylase domain-containing protein [Niabella pedocola]
MICFAKIPFVSPGSIATELASYPSGWQAHFNTLHYQGEWTVLPLRTPGGKDHIVPDLMGEQGYADTVHMQYFPSVGSLLRSLDCPVRSVRFLNLKAGAYIKPHRDHELAFEMGEARLHFPILTNPDVAFFVEDTRLNMQPGECWYINANLTHQVSNKGTTDRVHLVVDCLVNDWLRELFSHAHTHTKTEAVDVEQQKQVIAALRLQNTPAATQLADQLEQKLRMH